MIFVVAPMPPPIGGFAVINQHMVDQLKGRTWVQVFDRAPAVSWRVAILGTAVRAIGLFARFIASAKRDRPAALYLALSGGAGRWLDIPFAAMAAILGWNIYIHHHSFAYLRQPTRTDRFIMKVLSGAVHIVLCERMQELLCGHYKIPQTQIRQLSNAAFLEPLTDIPAMRATQKIVVGYFSAVTVAKGAYRFLQTIDALRQADIDVTGRMAGPLSADEADAFRAALAGTPDVVYVGPVYGEEKSAFLAELDLLLFPSDYKNEAEPVAISEALQFGVKVLSTDIGCCSSLVGVPALGSAFTFERYTASVIDYARRGLRDGTLRDAPKTAASFEEKRSSQRIKLNQLLDEICTSASRDNAEVV